MGEYARKFYGQDRVPGAKADPQAKRDEVIDVGPQLPVKPKDVRPRTAPEWAAAPTWPTQRARPNQPSARPSARRMPAPAAMPPVLDQLRDLLSPVREFGLASQRFAKAIDAAQDLMPIAVAGPGMGRVLVTLAAAGAGYYLYTKYTAPQAPRRRKRIKTINPR